MLIAKADFVNAEDIFRRALEKSEPVIFPTDTIYGVGAPLADTTANEKIFDIKGREKGKPFPVLISDTKQLENIAVVENSTQERVINEIWPAPVTMIMKAAKGVNPLFTLNGTIAVRMPEKQWLKNLIEETGPLSATSANLSGVPYENDFDMILKSFTKHVNFYIYENHTGNSSSAIIDISSSELKIIRKSPHLEKIIKILG